LYETWFNDISNLIFQVQNRRMFQTATIKHAYRCSNGIADLVFIHPSSLLRKSMPQFLVYQELLETSDKKFMINVTAVEPDWLVECAQAYCSFGEPMDDPQPW